jgi:hypothetical protein
MAHVYYKQIFYSLLLLHAHSLFVWYALALIPNPEPKVIDPIQMPPLVLNCTENPAPSMSNHDAVGPTPKLHALIMYLSK